MHKKLSRAINFFNDDGVPRPSNQGTLPRVFINAYMLLHTGSIFFDGILSCIQGRIQGLDLGSSQMIV